MIKKYVITGGPSSGKTVTLKYLEKEGYHIVPEAARIIIEEQKKINGTLVPWIRPYDFQIALFNKQIELESATDKIAFTDRGIIDNIGYCKYYKISVPDEIKKASKIKRYEKIFFLEQLGSYVKDNVRKENSKDAKKISNFIKEAYFEFGYKPIFLPAVSVEERAEIIRLHL